MSVSIPETLSDSGQRPVRSQWLGRNWWFPNWGGWPRQHTSSGMELPGYSPQHAVILKSVHLLPFSCTEVMLLSLKSFTLRDKGKSSSSWIGWQCELSEGTHVFTLWSFCQWLNSLMVFSRTSNTESLFAFTTAYSSYLQIIKKWLVHARNERVYNSFMCDANQRCKSDIQQTCNIHSNL